MFRFGLIGALAWGAVACGAVAAGAGEVRFPKTGKHAFQVNLPKGWNTRADARGGLLLVPPPASQHAMVYISIVVDDKLRGSPTSAVAAAAAKSGGIAMNDKQEPERVSDPQGAKFYRGTAYYGTIPAKRGMARRAKIVIFALTPNTWAQIWVVTQPGIGSLELAALDRVLNSLSLISEP